MLILGLATRSSRLGAYFIDILIMLSAYGILIYCTDIINKLFSTGEISSHYILILVIYGFAIFLTFHAYLLFKNGQTFGKWVFDIAIVKKNGTKINGMSIALKRMLPFFLITYIPLIGIAISIINILFIFRKDQCCLHDMFAGTKVVQLTNKLGQD